MQNIQTFNVGLAMLVVVYLWVAVVKNWRCLLDHGTLTSDIYIYIYIYMYVYIYIYMYVHIYIYQ